MKGYTIRSRRLTDEEFFRIRREEVLPQWETGRQLENLDECIAAAYELSVGLGRNYALKLAEAEAAGKHLLQPQFGRALTEYMLDGMGYVETESPLVPWGLWNIFSDSYTRKNKYELAARGIERSRETGDTMLNGWPIVNFGVEEARKLRRAVKSPMTLNSTDEDGRLASETALAAGWNACNCRSVTEVMAHCKNIRLDEEIRINQYESRLAAIYDERGVSQCPHISCNLTGYDSCGFKAFIMVAQSLLGAEQGLRRIYFEFGLNMNMVQDAAMIRVVRKLSRDYCERFGYRDMKFFTGSFPYLGAWPPRVEEACSMISWNTAVSMMAGCTAVILKCRDEAFATPTMEGMAASVRMARHLDTLLGDQRLPMSDALREEERMLELEVRALMDKCLDAGGGDIALGLCLGVDYGWVQTMITPWKYNRGNVLLMRDAENAMRYFDAGDMPLPREVREYHLDKLKSRAAREGRPLDFDMVIADLQYASRLPEIMNK
jgi:methylaspartate mutase epsilon subunit